MAHDSTLLAAVQRAARMEAAEDPMPDEDEDEAPEGEGEDAPPEDEEETSTSTTVTTNTTTGTAAAERKRILGIQAAMFPGQEELAAAMIADGRTTPAAAALRFNRAFKAAGIAAPNQLASLEAMDKHTRVPANQRGSTGKAPPVAQNAEGWKAEWAASKELQNEFDTAESYAGFKVGSAAGRIRIKAERAA